MAINLSTAGIKMYYAVEATAGIRPTTYTNQLAGLKEVPEMNPSPETLETTDLAVTDYKTYINGLKDLGGSLGFMFNFTQDFVTAWEALVTAYEAVDQDGKVVWFKIDIPGLTKKLYFPGIPSALGLPGIGVNAVLEITAYITQTGGLVWA